MGEISLVCPGCTAEYRVPEHAIPSEGREVECSNCGRVWLAAPVMTKPAPLDLASLAIPAPEAETPPSAPETAEPQPSRRLPETVFNILRDEVEHEKRVRAAKSTVPTKPPVAGSDHKSDSTAGTESDWPATTVIVPGQRDLPPAKVSATVEAPRQSPHPLPMAAFRDEFPDLDEGSKDAGPKEDMPRSPTPIRPAIAEQIINPTAQPRPAPAISQTSTAPTARGYRLGFRLALLVLAAALAVYSAAPQLAGKGGAGEELAQWRVQIDKGRLWLQEQVASLTR
jgi:predicted Zn finger-like uncharacterized protein